MKSLKTAELLKKQEGVRRFAYFCPANQLTVGAGRNIQQIPFSEDEIDLMLNNDIKRVVKELSKTFNWFSELEPARMDAMICIGYNLGINRLLRFKRALYSMSISEWSEAADHFRDSKWAKVQVPARASLLARMIETNEYPKT